MKVLHTIPSLDPKLGGPTEVVLQLVAALRENNVDAEIATTNDGGKEMFDLPLYKLIQYRGCPVRIFPRSEYRYRQFIYSPEYRDFLTANVSKYDLLDNHYLFTYSSLAASIACQRQNVPYTTRAMGQLTEWSLSHRALKKRIYYSLFERKNLLNAAAIHCTSEGEVADVHRLLPEAKTILLPLGVKLYKPDASAASELRNRFRIPQGRPVVLFLSRLHEKKRPELLIRAASLLPETDVHYLIAGEGEPEFEQSLRTLAEQLHVADKVSFVGHIDGRDKELALLGSDLFVLPSHSENFGVAVAEALSAGLPVIVTDGVQISDAIRKHGAGLVVTDTPEEIKNTIVSLLGSPDTRSRMGTNGRELARIEYSWLPIARKLTESYQELLTKPLLPVKLS